MYLITYSFTSDKGSYVGRVFTSFAHTPPTMKDIQEAEVSLKQNLDLNGETIKNLFITGFYKLSDLPDTETLA